MTFDTRDVTVALSIPAGFVPLPLTDVDSSIVNAAKLLDDVDRPGVVSAASQILPALGACLHALAKDRVRYCGLGSHSFGDTVVTSILTVVVYDTGGDTENPRLVVKNLAESKVESSDKGDLQVIEIDKRPMMFFERIRDLPVPDFPGNPADGKTTPVFQLEAAVTTSDGSAIAAIEFSTMFAEHGPHFRQMIVSTARSIDIQIQKAPGSVLNL
ncbi:hypothetical protein G4X40_21055 [Rhodococcus sp. D2-41]|uniref:hypothetical protein n=1 Tax=Speluncibacter jeojiensis TaxID=2710754 RepID=UPI002410B5E7|nr:hypothetical protein [Rhodococcus sp. D2-41]MDG3012633.1 hypothetical protein [Rhodococcus sp. D2-41]